jgi:hypothetical protein
MLLASAYADIATFCLMPQPLLNRTGLIRRGYRRLDASYGANECLGHDESLSTTALNRHRLALFSVDHRDTQDLRRRTPPASGWGSHPLGVSCVLPWLAVQRLHDRPATPLVMPTTPGRPVVAPLTVPAPSLVTSAMMAVAVIVAASLVMARRLPTRRPMLEWRASGSDSGTYVRMRRRVGRNCSRSQYQCSYHDKCALLDLGLLIPCTAHAMRKTLRLP